MINIQDIYDEALTLDAGIITAEEAEPITNFYVLLLQMDRQSISQASFRMPEAEHWDQSIVDELVEDFQMTQGRDVKITQNLETPDLLLVQL